MIFAFFLKILNFFVSPCYTRPDLRDVRLHLRHVLRHRLLRLHHLAQLRLHLLKSVLNSQKNIQSRVRS